MKYEFLNHPSIVVIDFSIFEKDKNPFVFADHILTF